MQSEKKYRKIGFISLLLTIAWMGLIFYFSSQPGSVSSVQSSQFEGILSEIVPTTKQFFGFIKDYGLSIFSIRKLAHMFLYFILAILSYMSIYLLKGDYVLAVKSSMLIAILYASLDEIHQLYIEGRSGLLTDVWVDSIGVFMGIIVVSIVKIYKKKCKNKK